jgi:hypothetical protein
LIKALNALRLPTVRPTGIQGKKCFNQKESLSSLSATKVDSQRSSRIRGCGSGGDLNARGSSDIESREATAVSEEEEEEARIPIFRKNK